MGRRIKWLGLVLLACFAVLLIQLTNIQFRQASALANSPTNPKVVQAKYDKSRGDILAADGTVLATSTKAPKGYLYKYQRNYPTGPLFSQVVGFQSYIYGTYGVEATYNKYLLPHKQAPRSLGQLLSPTQSTDSVTLTVQPALQRVAQQALAGRDGAVVALNPRTGAIEAMYSNPSFDPNPLSSQSGPTEKAAWSADNVKDPEGFAPLSNLAVSQIFAPGSTFKVVTASAAYDHAPQVVNKQYPSVSFINLPNSNKTFQNYGGATCGGDIATMLPPSCDTGFAQVGMDVGATYMHQEATSFGWNAVPPLDFTTVGGIAPSHFPVPAYFAPNRHGLATLAYASIGQDDVAGSALQGAMDAAAIANGGVIMKPHVMAQVHDAQGNVVTSYSDSAWRHATSAATAQAVGSLMQKVVTASNGTAHNVGFRPQDQVAAKTGTSESGVNNQYDTDWMIAFAPATHPKVAVAVVLPQQAPSSTGASCSGPVMNNVIQAALGNTTNLPSPTAGC